MWGRILKSVGMAALASSLNVCLAATFGTVVPVHGTVSDIALDERREIGRAHV